MASLASTLHSASPSTTLLRRPSSGPNPTRAVNFATKARSYKSPKISCSVAQPETLQVVQCTIAKQLSIDEATVMPQTKFADLGADSLDTVEIMMALEEKFEVSIGEGGAENIATVQDAADLIEKVKAAAA